MSLAGRGYDADWIRALVNAQAAWANIPPKRQSNAAHVLWPLPGQPHASSFRGRCRSHFAGERGRARNPVITAPVIEGGDEWVPGSPAARGPGHDETLNGAGKSTATNKARAMTIAARTPDVVSIAEPVGDVIAHALAELGVTTAFGVISIHNMPILDAMARHNRIRFVPARSEAGAMNMADAFARVSRSLGVVITSTGTAAGNAAGSQLEALTAGSPVLHITTQVDREFVDRDRAAIHDVPRQPDMLKAISKTYLRVWEPASAVDSLLAAASEALAAPSGPVTLELP